MKTVLFIAYNFPPHGGAGVQRSTKFVKYLPEFGWQPVVVTALDDASLVLDSSLMTDIPSNTPIFRVPGFSIEKLRWQAKRFGLSKLVTLLNLLLQIPDAHRFWANNVFKKIDNIIQIHKPELVYTTSGPYSDHLVGMWLKQKLGLPWFADFRDPWSKNLLLPYLPGYRALNRYIERQVLATADRVACVSKPWLDDLYQNLGLDRDKFIVLPNGYDLDDIEVTSLSTTNDVFTITHLGSFYSNRRPDVFIEAIQQLIKNNKIPASNLRALFIGKNAKQHIPNQPPFEVRDYIPHKELNYFRQQTHVNLLILATSADNIGNHSGKIFEYIASNRPILGIVPKGGVAEALINETRTGIATSGDVGEIAIAIETLYQQWKQGQFEWNPDQRAIQRYTRRNLTRQLAAEFDYLANMELQE